jgi:hypothetical protein
MKRFNLTVRSLVKPRMPRRRCVGRCVGCWPVRMLWPIGPGRWPLANVGHEGIEIQSAASFVVWLAKPPGLVGPTAAGNDAEAHAGWIDGDGLLSSSFCSKFFGIFGGGFVFQNGWGPARGSHLKTTLRTLPRICATIGDRPDRRTAASPIGPVRAGASAASERRVEPRAGATPQPGSEPWQNRALALRPAMPWFGPLNFETLPPASFSWAD